MEFGITDREMRILLKSQKGELEGVMMYKALADVVDDPKDAEVFKQLAAEEGHHAAVFRRITKKDVVPGKVTSFLLPRLYKLIGKERLYPIIANGEYAADKTYGPLAEIFTEVQEVKSDEKRHGHTVMGLLG